MHIPNEIVLVIVSCLGRSDLKAARLVSKTWCVYVSTLLFRQAVIEVLKQSRHLDTFEIAPHARLFHNRDDEDDDDESIYDAKTFSCSFEDVENYVDYGGRHPRLRDGQPDSAANLYMMDEAITPALRERIFNAQV